MKVLGIDPGSLRTGYALIEMVDFAPVVLDFGVWELSTQAQSKELGKRLEVLYQNCKKLLLSCNPHLIGFEKAVSFKSVPSALTLSEARGVLRLAMHEVLEEASLRIIELSPTAIKKKSTGSGASRKGSVERVLSMRFPNLKELSKNRALTHDAFDALAVAWTAWIVHKERHGRKTGAAVCS